MFSVKQFSAALVILFLMQIPLKAGAQVKCVDVLSRLHLESDKEEPGHRKETARFLNQHKNLHEKVDVKPGLPEKAINILYMGILARIFDIKHDLAAKKNVAVPTDIQYEGIKKYTKEVLENSNLPPFPAFENKINELFKVENLTDDTVMIQIKHTAHNEIDNLVFKVISARFANMYMQVANWVYQFSGLVENKPMKAATMMDELSAEERKTRTIMHQLVFDKKVWEAQLRIIQLKIAGYLSETDPEKKNAMLERMAYPDEPLLPFAGILSTKSLIPGEAAPRELKRYFQNDFEDPMNLLNLKKKDDFKIRYKMIYRTVEMMPKRTELEIHAHSLAHMKAYLKWGFHKALEYEDPLFPGVPIYLLKAKREDVLPNIQAILEKTQ